MLDLLQAIESGVLEQQSTLEELERVKHFVTFLAREGAIPDESDRKRMERC
jgi:hypothetical protein